MKRNKPKKKKQEPWYTKLNQGGDWKICKFTPCKSPHRQLDFRGFCSENCMRGEHINQDKGYQFDLGHSVRSHWERRYADWLIRRRLRYKYEPKKFNLKYRDSRGNIKTIGYVPDFLILRQRGIPIETWVEVKGFMSDKDKLKIELFKKTKRKLLVVDKSFFKSKYSYS